MEKIVFRIALIIILFSTTIPAIMLNDGNSIWDYFRKCKSLIVAEVVDRHCVSPEVNIRALPISTIRGEKFSDTINLWYSLRDVAQTRDSIYPSISVFDTLWNIMNIPDTFCEKGVPEIRDTLFIFFSDCFKIITHIAAKNRYSKYVSIFNKMSTIESFSDATAKCVNLKKLFLDLISDTALRSEALKMLHYNFVDTNYYQQTTIISINTCINQIDIEKLLSIDMYSHNSEKVIEELWTFCARIDPKTTLRLILFRIEDGDPGYKKVHDIGQEIVKNGSVNYKLVKDSVNQVIKIIEERIRSDRFFMELAINNIIRSQDANRYLAVMNNRNGNEKVIDRLNARQQLISIIRKSVFKKVKQSDKW